MIGWVRADAVADQAAANAEIALLRTDNQKYRDDLARFKAIKPKPDTPDLDDQDREMTKLLSSIKLIIPAETSRTGEETESDLFSLGYGNRDQLIVGVFNEYGMSEAAKFLYFTLLPKLQAHGLADNERVPGKQYRRAYLNRAGQAFFARAERQLLKKQVEPTDAKQKQEPPPPPKAKKQPKTGD